MLFIPAITLILKTMLTSKLLLQEGTTTISDGLVMIGTCNRYKDLLHAKYVDLKTKFLLLFL